MARVSQLGSFAVATLAVLALSAALATLINAITAGGESNSRVNCLRDCRVGEYHTCHFEFRVHSFQTYAWNCRTCGNLSCTNRIGCIQADGITRLITVVNEQLPGPSIQVCEGDTVKVTVNNHLVSSGVSIHWHGMSMRGRNEAHGSPHMDGEPGVTQCPILPHTKFTYTFTANPSGSHFWHAQTGFQRSDGVFGPLIVRNPKGLDPNDHLYDEDLPDHVIMVNDWTHILGEEKFFLHLLSGFTDFPKSILVNGIGSHQGNSIVSVPHPVKPKRFRIVKGTRYRFRLISGGFLNCPISVSIEGHTLTVIATDGSPIIPYNVTSIVIFPGERWDFVLSAYNYPQAYWISFMGLKDCLHDSVFQTAVLDYVSDSSSHHLREEQENESNVLPSEAKPKFRNRKPRGKQINGVDGICSSESPCLSDLKSSEPLPQGLSAERADVTLYFGFSKMVANRTAVKGHFPQVLKELKLPPEVRLPVPHINGFTFNTPPSPVIFQLDSYNSCDASASQSKNDECLHIEKIPLGAITDLFLVEEGNQNKENVVHLHGYRFYILSEQWGPLEGHQSSSGRRTDLVKKMDSTGQIKRNLINPIQKDTVSVPREGFALVRFKADNPGYWMLESQLLFDSHLGMKVILQVGDHNEIPKPPIDYPNCGNFH